MRIEMSFIACEVLLIGGLCVLPAMAAEDKPKDHNYDPSAEQIREAISDYIADIVSEEGAFFIDDDITGQTRELKLANVTEGMGKIEGYYRTCTAMEDVHTGELLDIDFDVDTAGGKIEVTNVFIHRLNGKPRYGYDDKGERIPVE